MAACRPKAPREPLTEEPQKPKPPLKLMVINDESLAEQIERLWKSRGDRTLDVERVTAAEIADRKRLAADLIVFPSNLLVSLAEKKLIESWSRGGGSRESETADADVFSMQRLREPLWGPKVNAVSFGSPQFVLYLRNDHLQKIRRSPPNTWSEYLEVIDELVEENGNDTAANTSFAVAEPLAAGWASRVFLAHAAPYVRHRSQFSDVFDYSTLKPLIDGPPFERALKELVLAAKHAPPEVTEATPEVVKKWFYEGRVAIAWSWPTKSFDIAREVPKPIDTDLVEFAELPGATEAFLAERGAWEKREKTESVHVPLSGIAGRMGAVARGTRDRLGATDALRWLTGAEFSVAVSSASSAVTCYRASHKADPAWMDVGLPLPAAQSYGEIVETTQGRAQSMSLLCVPGSDRYLDVLDQAVRRAVIEQSDPLSELKNVAKQWEEITESIGRDSQLAAYRRSLGLEP